jgi:hypothetical protein
VNIVKTTSTIARIPLATTEVSATTALPHTHADACLDSEERTVKPTLTSALRSHAKTEESVKMASTNTHASAYLDSQERIAKSTLTSAFLMIPSFSCQNWPLLQWLPEMPHMSDALSTDIQTVIWNKDLDEENSSTKAKSKSASMHAEKMDSNTLVFNGTASAGVATATDSTDLPQKHRTRNATAEWEPRSSPSGAIASTI